MAEIWNKPKVIGITRVRNEESIMKDTLDHMATFCSEVMVYDDSSTDRTVEICKNHHIVTKVIEGEEWDLDRERAEHENRQAVYLEARKVGDDNDWIVYMDADERIEFNWDNLICADFDCVKMRLFDFYITAEDVHLPYTERTKMGVEYRDINFAFRLGKTDGYSYPDQRECTVRTRKVLHSGYVRHYGKAISVEQWEDTCEYYATCFPRYASKWEARKGKAIHTVSDFGNELITWCQRLDKRKIIDVRTIS